MFKRTLLLASALALLAAPATAQDKIKIGFVTTLTTGAAVIGNDMRNAVELALEHIDNKMGALDVEVIYGDDEFNPQKGRQRTEKLVRQDDVDIVAGYIWSHVLLASANVALDAGKILISSNAGPSQLAGESCHRNFFNVSWQNDQTPMAMGEVLNEAGVDSLYIIAPNYAAGQNMVAGVERTFRGEIVGKDMTTWPSQLDWAAELSKVRAANPDGVFIFYPGRHGPAFISQYQQAGIDVPLYTVFTIDSLSLPRFQEAQMAGVLGTVMTPVLGARPGQRAEPALRRRLSGEARHLPVVLCGPELRHDLPDQVGGRGRRRQHRRHRSHAGGHGAGRVPVGAGQVQLRQQPLPGAGLLQPRGRCRRRRQLDDGGARARAGQPPGSVRAPVHFLIPA